MGLPRAVVNHILYGQLQGMVRKDPNHLWWPDGLSGGDDELAHAHVLLLDALRRSIRRPPRTIPRTRPMELELGSPLFFHARFYLFRLKSPGGGGSRSYINLTINDVNSAGLMSFDHSGGYRVILMGFDLVDEVFVLFDADIYEIDGGFRYNRFCYVDHTLPVKAIGLGIVRETRSLRTPRVTETVIGCRSDMLVPALEERHRRAVARVIGE